MKIQSRTFRNTRPLGWQLVLAASFFGGPLALAPAAVAPSEARLTIPCVVARYDTEGGLPNPRAQLVVQTRDSYIWVGTESGLARFDGLRFTTFRTTSDQSVGEGVISALHEDREGTLWIGHSRGLTRYRDGRFEAISGIQAVVTCIASGTGGRIWVASPAGGIWRVENNHVTALGGERTRSGGREARVIFEDLRGTVWVGTRNGLRRVIGDRVETVPETKDQFFNVETLGEAPDGALWIGSAEGNFRLKDGALTRWVPPKGESEGAAACFYTDHAGRFFLVSRRVYHLPDSGMGAPEMFPVPETDFPRTIVQDHEGSYWIGTRGDGLVRVRESAFEKFSHVNSSLPDDTAVTVAVDDEGVAWVGYANQTLANISPVGVVEQVRIGLPSSSGQIWALGFDAEDGLWIGTRGSLFRWREGQLDEFPAVKFVRAIYRDRSGTLWFGTQNSGIVKWQDGVFTGYKVGNEDKSGLVFAENSAGELLVGNHSGLFRMSGGRPVAVPGLPDKRVRALHVDSDGNLWVSARDLGLIVFTRGKWFVPTALNETLLKLVTSIDEDALGNLWFGSGRGICWVSRTNLLASLDTKEIRAELHLASQSESLRPDYSAFGNHPYGSFGNQPITARGPDGRLWFAQRTGVVLANPAALRINKSPPPIRIQRVLADNEPVESSSGRILFPVGTRRISIEFAALSFVQPANVLSRYRLLGVDASWTPAGPGRRAVYTGLPPGRYNFQVTACNSDGVWNETGASLAFTVQPAYWQTLWFRGLALASLAGVTGLGVWRVTRAKLRRQSLQLEQQRVISQERARAAAVTEATSDLVVFARPGGQLLFVNRAGRRMIGLGESEELFGKNIGDLHPRWAAERLVNYAIPTAKREGIWSGESALLHRDGNEIPVSQVIVAHRSSDGSVEFVSSIARDITQAKHAEMTLRERDARYQLVVRGFGAALWDWNVTTNEVFYAPRFKEMLGYTDDEFPSRPESFYNVLHPDDHAVVRRGLDAHFSPLHTPYDVEYRLRTKSGEYRWFHATGETLRNEDGKPYRMAGSIIDITGRKLAEERGQRFQEQLRALSSRLESLREEERIHLSREIHDHLGQLLTALKLEIRSLERKLAGVSDAELSAVLASKIVSAQALTDETISAVQKIAAELRPGALDRLGLPAAVEVETQAFQSRTGLHCEWTIPKDSVALPQEYATATFRIFQEILTNIARHAKATCVTVRLGFDDGAVELQVEDDGIGIRQSDLENPKSLGLLGMRERVALLGGTLRFEGKSGQGTTVTLRIRFAKNGEPSATQLKS